MFGFIRFISPDFHVEKYLGTFFMILPNSKDEKMIENFKKIEYNAQRYISPFDIHDTLLYMLYYYDEDRKDSYSETGQTVFEDWLDIVINIKTSVLEYVFAKKWINTSIVIYSILISLLFPF